MLGLFLNSPKGGGARDVSSICRFSKKKKGGGQGGVKGKKKRRANPHVKKGSRGKKKKKRSKPVGINQKKDPSIHYFDPTKPRQGEKERKTDIAIR